MTIDLVVNIFLVFFISNPVGIYATANLGYFVMFFFVLTGFLLLRKDRKNWPRPIRLGKIWVPIAALLALLTVVLAAIGSWRTDLTGYGTKTELAIAVGLLLLSVVLWAYRQRVEERRPIQWRDLTDSDPVEMGHEADLEQTPVMAGTSER